jgi:replicative DNA helicase
MTTPTEPGSEFYAVSSMLQSPHAITKGLTHLSADDFDFPLPALVFATIATMVERGIPVDRDSVEQNCRAALSRLGGPVALHNLHTYADTPENIDYHIDILRETSGRRQALAASQRFTQMVAEGIPVTECATEMRTALDLIRTAAITDVPSRSVTVDAWLAVEDVSETWVVPKLIAPTDVFLLLSQPGHGKSTLLRQVALCVAAGVHPFDPDRRIEPCATMLVDLENAARDVKSEMCPLVDRLRQIGDWDPERARILPMPEGLNIRTPQGADLLEREIEKYRPAVVCLGPIYKAAPKLGDDWDTSAEQAREFFDRMRAAYGTAFMLEHHMSKQTQYDREAGSPYGSTVWERWPSFGRVLRPIDGKYFELTQPFRHDRAPREIPAGLYRGGLLPWSPIWDQVDVDIYKQQAKSRKS